MISITLACVTCVTLQSDPGAPRAASEEREAVRQQGQGQTERDPEELSPGGGQRDARAPLQC